VGGARILTLELNIIRAEIKIVTSNIQPPSIEHLQAITLRQASVNRFSINIDVVIITATTGGENRELLMWIDGAIK
jgi:hypothetical protein